MAEHDVTVAPQPAPAPLVAAQTPAKATAQSTLPFVDETLAVLGWRDGAAALAMALAGRLAPAPPAPGQVRAHDAAPGPALTPEQTALRAELEATIASGSSGRVHDLVDDRGSAVLGLASDAEKIAMLTILKNMTVPALWFIERTMETIWDSFGPARILEVAANNDELWEGCVARGADLHALDALKGPRAAFMRDVRATAERHMASNLAATDRELDALGISIPERKAAPEPRPGDHAVRGAQVATLMAQADLARLAAIALTELPVGYRVGKWNSPSKFRPGEPPMLAPSADDLSSGAMSRFEDVQSQYEVTQSFLAAAGSTSPAVYAATKRDRLDDFATAQGRNGLEARAVIAEVLGELRANIVVTRERVAAGTLDYRALVPVHEALFSGAEPSAEGMPWNTRIGKAIARGIAGEHEARRQWNQIKAGLLAGGAFLTMELFTGGLATGPGVALFMFGTGIGLGVAGLSWADAVRLSSASRSAADAKHELVTPEQVTAAKWEALLNTVFAGLDAVAPAWRAGRAMLRSARSAELIAEQSMRGEWARVSALTGEAAVREGAPVVERLVVEHGVEGATQLTGRTAEQLAELTPAGSDLRVRLRAAANHGIVGPAATAQERSAAGAASAARLRALAEAKAGTSLRKATTSLWLRTGPLKHQLGQLVEALDKEIIDRTVADQLVLEGIERYGPQRTLELVGGWKHLADALTNGSAAAKPFLAWRKVVFDDLKAFAKRELGLEIRMSGGSVGTFKNDLDISIQGIVSSEHRERLSAHLAQQLRVADRPALYNDLLMLELFIDPTRMHAYDALPAALRETVSKRHAAFAKELVPQRDLHRALTRADPAMIARVRGQMEALGVTAFKYRHLRDWEIRVIQRRLDVAHRRLVRAYAAGDNAAVEKAADELCYSSALIEASGEGGYFTAGGVRTGATERKGSDLVPIVEGALKGLTPFEHHGAMLDQLSKLNHAAEDLINPRLGQDVVAAMRATGKYGARAGELAKGSTVVAEEVVLPPRWDGLIKECAAMKTSAEEVGALDALRLAPEATRAKALALLDEASEATVAALLTVQKEVGLHALPGAAEEMIKQIQNTAVILRAIEVLKDRVGALGRAGAAVARQPDGASAPGVAQ